MSLCSSQKSSWGSAKADQDKFTVAELLPWTHMQQDPSLNQTAALKQGLFVSPSTEQWVWVSLPTGGEGCSAGLYW